MKYTYLINQGSIVEHGFGDKTDLIDWALIDYIMKWQTSPKSKRIDDYVWIDYKQTVKDNPMLGLNTKASISKRLNKMVDLDLIECKKDSLKRAYFKITQLTSDIISFRCSQPPLTRVNEGKQGVNEGKQGVNEGKQGVNEGLHIKDQHLYDQYDKTNSSNPKKPKKQGGAKSTPTWNAYSRAYLQRYRVAPLRSAKVNSLLCRFVDEVGADDAPLIAAYYLRLSDQWYLKKSHDIPTLVQNSQGIRTQWATGTKQTTLDHRRNERRETTKNAVDEVIQKIDEQEKI